MSGKQLRNLLRVVFGLGMLAWIAAQIDWRALRALAREGDPRELALGVGCLVFAMLGLQWTRLHVLIRGYTQRLSTSLKIFFVGALFNNFLPSNVGGDAMRLFYLQALRAENVGTPFMLLLVYRLSSLCVLVAAGALYLVLEHERLARLLAAQRIGVHAGAAVWVVVGLLLSAAALALVWLRKRLSQRIVLRVQAFFVGCSAALNLLTRADLISLAAQTLAFHFCRMLSFFFLVRYMGQQASLWDLTFVISATALIAVLPISVAGVGVIEASITGLLTLYGVDLSCAGAVAFVNRAVLLLAAAVGALIYLRSSPSLHAEPLAKTGA